MIKENQIKKILLIFVLIVSLFIFSCSKRVKIEFPGGIKIESPIVRVGIGENLQKTSISSTMGMKIYKGGELLSSLNKGNIFIKNLSRSISISIEDAKYRVLSTLYIIPKKDSFLKYDNKEYRGIIEILLTEEGFNVINILNIEEYLKGVVPYELPPKTYSKIEALKAQAIAARTYTLYTLGKYKDKGFDICSTIACQVYNGKKGETPLSNRAVEETDNLVMVYNNKLIPALYSASCGGFTENIENVFAGEKSPVLTGKPCDYDNIKLNWIYTDVFKPYSVEENLAIILKITKENIIKKGSILIDRETANSILTGIYKITGKSGKLFQNSDISISSIIIKVNKTFSFYKKAVKYIRGFEIPQELMFKYGKEKSYIMVHLYKEGILKHYNRLDIHLTVKQFIDFTMRLLIKYYNVFEDSKYISSESKTILLKNSFNKEERYYINGTIFYRKVNNRLYPAHMLYFTGREKLKLFAIKNRLKILIVDYPPFSLSPKNIYPLWHKIYKKTELEKIVKTKLSLDSLKDIVPLKRGVSGRINKLEIQGDRKSFFLFGLKIKKTLNLKDNNFIIDRWFDGQNIIYFTFIGRGWGHGVGMCQVGAYGMALQGNDYEDILKYYYTGVSIVRYDSLIKKK
jgi:stage II sporulation protein D